MKHYTINSYTKDEIIRKMETVKNKLQQYSEKPISQIEKFNKEMDKDLFFKYGNYIAYMEYKKKNYILLQKDEIVNYNIEKYININSYSI